MTTSTRAPRSRVLRAAGGAVLLLAMAASTRQAGAQSAADVAVARDLFREASQLAQQGNWEGARDRYERSLKLKRAAITFYSLGVAEKNTSHFVEALEHFRAFLSEPSTPHTRAFEEPATLAVAELAKRVGRLTFKIEPQGAEPTVTVDGEAVPPIALDRPRLVNPGARVVVVTARGYKRAEQRADVTEGGAATVTFVLERAPADAPPAPVAPDTALKAPPPAQMKPDRTLPIILIGAGGALFAGGLVIGLLGVSQASDAPTKEGPEASGARTKALVGDILGGTGIASAAVGGVLLILGKPTKREAQRAVTPWAHGSVVGLSVAY